MININRFKNTANTSQLKGIILVLLCNPSRFKNTVQLILKIDDF